MKVKSPGRWELLVGELGWVRVTDEAKRRPWGYGVCRAALSFEDL
jgi:hypothetical protein